MAREGRLGWVMKGMGTWHKKLPAGSDMANCKQQPFQTPGCSIMRHGLVFSKGSTALHVLPLATPQTLAAAARYPGVHRTASLTAVYATPAATGTAQIKSQELQAAQAVVQVQQHSLHVLLQQLCRVPVKQLPTALQQMEEFLQEMQHAQHAEGVQQVQESGQASSDVDGQPAPNQLDPAAAIKHTIAGQMQDGAQHRTQVQKAQNWELCDQEQQERDVMQQVAQAGGVEPQQWVTLLEQLLAAQAVPGPRLLQALYRSTPARFLRYNAPLTTATLLLAVLRLTASIAKPRKEPKHAKGSTQRGVDSQEQGLAGRMNQQDTDGLSANNSQQHASASQITRSWVLSTLAVLEPYLGQPSKLPPSLLIQILRALASHPGTSAPPHSCMNKLYANLASQVGRHPSGLAPAGAVDISMLSDMPAGTAHGKEGAGQVAHMRLGSKGTEQSTRPVLSMSIAHLQQLMWAISRLVTAKGAAAPGPQFTKMVQERSSTCLSGQHGRSSMDNVRAASAICISIAHLQAPPDMQLLQLSETASLNHLPALQPAMTAELIWAYARLGWRPSAAWLSAAVHHIHGAASIAPDKLAQALWALSMLLAPAPSLPQQGGGSKGTRSMQSKQGAEGAVGQQELWVSGSDDEDGAVIGGGQDSAADTALLQRLLPQLLARLQPHLPKLSGASLGTILWALARLLPAAKHSPALSHTQHPSGRVQHPVIRQQSAFLEALLLACTSGVATTSAHMAITMLWSVRRLGFILAPDTAAAAPAHPVHPTRTAASLQSLYIRHGSNRQFRSRLLLRFVHNAAHHALSGLPRVSATDHLVLVVSVTGLQWRPPPAWAHVALSGISASLHTMDMPTFSKLLQHCSRLLASSTQQLPEVVGKAGTFDRGTSVSSKEDQLAEQAGKSPRLGKGAASSKQHTAPNSMDDTAVVLGEFLRAATTTCAHHLRITLDSNTMQQLAGRTGHQWPLTSLAQAAEGLGTLSVQLAYYHNNQFSIQTTKSHDSTSILHVNQGAAANGKQTALQISGYSRLQSRVMQELGHCLAGSLACSLAQAWQPNSKHSAEGKTRSLEKPDSTPGKKPLASSLEQADSTHGMAHVASDLGKQARRSDSAHAIAHALFAACWLQHAHRKLLQQEHRQSAAVAQASAFSKTPDSLQAGAQSSTTLMPKPQHSTGQSATGSRRVAAEHSITTGLEQLLHTVTGFPLLPKSAVVPSPAGEVLSIDAGSHISDGWQMLRHALPAAAAHLVKSYHTAGYTDHGFSFLTGLLQAHVVLSVSPSPELCVALLEQVQDNNASAWRQAALRDTAAAEAMLHAIQQLEKLLHEYAAQSAQVSTLTMLTKQLEQFIVITPKQDVKLSWVTTGKQVSELVNRLSGASVDGRKALHSDGQSLSPFPMPSLPIPLPLHSLDHSTTHTTDHSTALQQQQQQQEEHAVQEQQQQQQQQQPLNQWLTRGDNQHMRAAVCARFTQLLPSMRPQELVFVLSDMAQGEWQLEQNTRQAVAKAVAGWRKETWAAAELAFLCRLWWSMTVLGLHLATDSRQLLDDQLGQLLVPRQQQQLQQQRLQEGWLQQQQQQQQEAVVDRQSHKFKPVPSIPSSVELSLLVCLLWSVAKSSLPTHVTATSLPSSTTSGKKSGTDEQAVAGQAGQGREQQDARRTSSSRKQRPAHTGRTLGGTQPPAWCASVAAVLASAAGQLSLDHLCTVMWSCSVLQERLEQQQPAVAAAHKGDVDTAHEAMIPLLLKELEGLYGLCQHQLFKQLTAAAVPSPITARRSRSRSPAPTAPEPAKISPEAVVLRPIASSDSVTVLSSLSVFATSLLAAIYAVASKRARARMHLQQAQEHTLHVQRTRDNAGSSITNPTNNSSSSSSSGKLVHCPFPYVLLTALAAGMPAASPHVLLSSLQLLCTWRIRPGKALDAAIRAKIQFVLEHVVSKHGSMLAPSSAGGAMAAAAASASGREPHGAESRFSDHPSTPRKRVWKLPDGAELEASQLLAIICTWTQMNMEIPRPIVSLVVRALLPVLPSSSHHEAVRAVRALVRMDAVVTGQAAALLMNGIAHHLQSPKLSGQGLVSLLSAMAQLSAGRDWQPGTPLLQDCCNALVKALPTLSTAHVAHALWAFAKLEHRPHRQCMAAMLVHVEQRMLRCRLKRLATILYSLAALGYQPPPHWLEGFYAATATRGQQAFAPRLASARACARGWSWRGYQHGIARGSVQQPGQADTMVVGAQNTSSAARLLWAAATLQLTPPPAWTAMLAQLVGMSVEYCTAHDLTLAAIGCAVLGPRLDDTWLAAFQAAVQAHAVGGDTHSKMLLMWSWRRLKGRVALDRREDAVASIKSRMQKHVGMLKTRRRLRIKLPMLRGMPVRLRRRSIHSRKVVSG